MGVVPFLRVPGWRLFQKEPEGETEKVPQKKTNPCGRASAVLAPEKTSGEKFCVARMRLSQPPGVCVRSGVLLGSVSEDPCSGR